MSLLEDEGHVFQDRVTAVRQCYDIAVECPAAGEVGIDTPSARGISGHNQGAARRPISIEKKLNRASNRQLVRYYTVRFRGESNAGVDPTDVLHRKYNFTARLCGAAATQCSEYGGAKNVYSQSQLFPLVDMAQ